MKKRIVVLVNLRDRSFIHTTYFFYPCHRVQHTGPRTKAAEGIDLYQGHRGALEISSICILFARGGVQYIFQDEEHWDAK